MQFELLLDLDMVPDLSLVLLKLGLIDRNELLLIAGSASLALRLHGDEVVGGVSLRRLCFLMALLHFHVHQNFYRGLDVLNHGEGVNIFQLLSFLFQLRFVIAVNLRISLTDRLLTSSLDRIFTLK